MPVSIGKILVIAALLELSSSWALPSSTMRAQEPVRVKAVHEPARPAPTQLLDRIAQFFRSPLVNVALVTIGLIGLIFEFKYPGTTLPGAVAAFCFVLFFWAHSFVGEFTILAIMLFLLGLVLLALEVFVIPGFGFTGIAGAVSMFVGLLLVTLEHWPADPNDWANVGSTFGGLAIGLALGVAGAVALTWSLPSVPFFNRMVLAPPSETPESMHPSLANSGMVTLLGAMGVAVTPLRPAGKAQFGEQFLDVVSEGDYVSPGGRVRVVEIEGTRIVVKEI